MITPRHHRNAYAALLLIFLLAVASVGCGQEPSTRRLESGGEIDLLQLLAPTPALPTPVHTSVGFQSRPAISLPVPGTFTAEVELPSGPSFLEFGAAIPEAHWQAGMPPVRLRVETTRASGSPGAATNWTELYDRRLDPANASRDRGWVDVRIPLDRWAGRHLHIRFTTNAPRAGDEGSLLLASPLVYAPPEVSADGEPAGRNVILILVDTLRADALGCYGRARSTSPHVDRLAAEGVLFERVHSPSPWTLPAVATIFTGMYPSRHGVHRDRSFTLPEERLTLAEIIRRAGWRTASVTANKLSGPEFGMAQGFQSADCFPASKPVRARAKVVHRRTVNWLRRMKDRPFFLYLHYLDPHDPYAPPGDFNRFASDPPPGLSKAVLRGRTGHGDLIRAGRASLSGDALSHLRSLYDGEVFYTDHYLGRLLAELQRLGIADRTAIVFTADHGEEFLEHGGLKHAATLYREVLDVPLIIRDPDRTAPGMRLPAPAQLSDLPATILALLGIDAPPDFGGVDLLGPAGIPADRPIFGEMMPAPSHPQTSEQGQDKRSVMLDRWKLIRNLHTGTNVLYDLANDPGEERDRYGEMEDVAAGLARRLDHFMSEGTATGREDQTGPTDQQRRMLEELGYLQ